MFVSGSEVFPLGIPLDGRRHPARDHRRLALRERLVARLSRTRAAAGALTRYKETSQFADAAENVDERFSGWHILGGAEFRLTRWLGVAGEIALTSVPDALGVGGVSEAFDETNLGGTSYRLKISVGR